MTTKRRPLSGPPVTAIQKAEAKLGRILTPQEAIVIATIAERGPQNAGTFTMPKRRVLRGLEKAGVIRCANAPGYLWHLAEE